MARLRFSFFLLAMFVAESSAQAASQTFGGLDCTIDCAAHSAGYLWAETRGITDPNFCPAAAYEDFHDGCLVYTGNPFRGAEFTDDALPIRGVARIFLKMRLLLGSNKIEM